MSRTGSLGLDLEILRRLNRDRLVRVLEDAPGSKDLVIDGDLLKMLDRIAGATLLRSHGVEKMHKLQRVPPPVQSGQRVYIVRPALVTIKYIADHIHEDARSHPDLRVHVVVVPRVTPGVTGLLEEEGLYGTLTIHEFVPEFVPLDDDLLSLEMTSFFRDAFLGGDYSGCVTVGRALNTLQGLYGAFPVVVAHGRASRAVVAALDALSAQESPKKAMQNPEIGHLFVFDRDADYITPLLSQLTYEGALDEHFGIQAGVVEFPKEVAAKDGPSKVPLNSRDTIYDNIRNRHFAGVSGYLITRAHEVRAKRDQAQSMTTAQIKDFVANEIQTLQNLQRSLSLHLSACEAITGRTRKDFDTQLGIEHGLVTGATSAGEAQAFLKDCLARMLPLAANLRLLCLYSLTQDGLSRAEYERLSRELLAAHGHRHLVTLLHLRQMGLLAVNDSSSSSSGGGADGNGGGGPGGPSPAGAPLLQDRLAQVASLLPRRGSGWRSAAKRLRLIPGPDESIDLHNPTHLSYVFNGAYTPAIPKVVGDVLAGRTPASQLPDLLKVLSPGNTQVRPAGAAPGAPGGATPPRVALVLVLGGLTFTEVAAFRLLALTASTRIILASTTTATGTDLVSAALL